MGANNAMNGLTYRLVRLIRTSKVEEFICELNHLLENDKPYPQIVIILEDVSGELVNLEIKRIKRMCNEVHVTKDKSEAIVMAINCIDKLTEAIRVTESEGIMKDIMMSETEMGHIWILQTTDDIQRFERYFRNSPDKSESHIVISTLTFNQTYYEFMKNVGVDAIYHGLTDNIIEDVIRKLKLKGGHVVNNDKEN